MALQREFLTSIFGFQVFGLWLPVTKFVYRRRWEMMLSIRHRQDEMFIPLIRARNALHDAGGGGDNGFAVDCYVDSLLGLWIPEDGGRNLTEHEMVSLCIEFLSVGIDSMMTVIQWTMVELVAHPEIQAKLRAEIHDVITDEDTGIDDEHLFQMPYLGAVVLEGFRRHPPARFVTPHAATEGGATFDGFAVPRHVNVNFTLGGMAMDEAVWQDARRFRPEPFLPGGEGEDLDLTGSTEIKMMPFGAGRRVCPGMNVAMLHMQYFVGSLVPEFEWSEVPGEPVDFAERLEMSIVMRRPLRAKLVSCKHKQ